MPHADHIDRWQREQEAREADPCPCPWDGRKPVMQVLTAPRWETRRLEARKAPRGSVLGWRAEPCPDFDADHAAEAELLRRWMP